MVLAALLLSLAGCSTSSRGHAADTVYLAPSFPRPGAWEPSARNLKEFERQIAALFEHPDERMKIWESISRPRYPFSDYFVQFSSAIIDGEDLLVARGFHRTLVKQLGFPYVEGVLSDGGSMYFSARYDPKSRKLVSLSFGGVG